MDNIIDLDEVEYIQSRRRRINSISVLDAVFMKDGTVIRVPNREREEFKYTGLSNIDFISSDFSPALAKVRHEE